MATTIINGTTVLDAPAAGPPGRGVLAGGATGQALVKATATDYDTVWASVGGASPLTTKGDLFTRDASAEARLPVGTDGQVLIADSAEATGLRWGAGGGGGGTWGSITGTLSDQTDLQSALDAKLASADIDTLAELNAIIADATLIDTGDSRLSDARTPTSHASSHQSGGGDAIKLDDLAAPDDNTDLDATISLHGLMAKADKSKLDAIEAGATADQTGAEIASAIDIQNSTDRTAFASGDKLLVYEAGVGNRRIDYDDLPGAGGGLANIVEDTTPQLGGQLDVNGFSIGNGAEELLAFVETASAINHIEIENAAVGFPPILRAAGDATNINLRLEAKGTGVVAVDGNRIVTVSDYGSGNNLDADTVDGFHAGTLLARAQHTGTQTLATISDAGAAAAKGVSGLDADAITGTAGTNGNLATWNGDGDLVDAGAVPYVHPNHTGDVTSTGDGATTIAADAVSNAKLADMSAWTIKLRNAGTSGDPTDAAVGDLTEDATPVSGDLLLGFLSTGEIRTFDVGNLPGGGGGGDFNGPASSTDNAILRFDGTGGKTGQDTPGATISDTNSLSLAGGTITADEPILNLSRTWNSGGVTFTGIKFNVTDTASAATSRPLQLQVGGSAIFTVQKNTDLLVNGDTMTGYTTYMSRIRGNASNSGVFVHGDGGGFFRNGFATVVVDDAGAGWISRSGGYFGWSDEDFNTMAGNFDLRLYRDAADVLALRRGTTAQAARIYNTFTNSSNYERGFLRWASNRFEIGTANAGTGTRRPLLFAGNSESTADPTTTEYPTDKDWGIHKNTTSSNVFLAFNDGGTIKKVQLT